MNSSIRPAQNSDQPWLVHAIKEGVQGGHFLSTVSAQAEQLVAATVMAGSFQMMKLRHGKAYPCTVRAQITVAETQGRPVSFLMTLLDEEGVELNMAYTDRQHRRQGHFQALLKHALSAYRSHGFPIYGRCYRKSSWAMDALCKQGFIVTAAGEPNVLTWQPETT